MKNITILFFATLFSLLYSCDKEDDLTPSNIKNNYFEVDPNATDPESVYRRNFYEKYGCYLLFNDTLRHEKIGETEDGNAIYFTETVDFKYRLTSLEMTESIRHEYLDDYDKKVQLTEIVIENLMTRLSKSLIPYSILTVKYIEVQNSSTSYQWEKTGHVYGKRCLAFSSDYILPLSDAELQEYFSAIIIELVVKKIQDLPDKTLKLFTDFCDHYYNMPKSMFNIPGSYDDEPLYEFGFIKSTSYSYFPSKSNDIESYIKTILELSEEEFLDTYGMYSNIVEKYYIMVDIMKELGVEL